MNKKIDNKRIGFHSIESIIKNNPHKIKKLFIPYLREDKRITNLIALADKNGIKYQVSKKLKTEPQAEIISGNNLSFQDLKIFLKDNSNKKLNLLILDNIIDPRNLGACIRSAAVTKVDAIIINKHHCAPLSDVVHSVSSGGAEYVRIFFVSNLVNCVKFIKDMNISVYGLSEHAQKDYFEVDFSDNSAVIMGSEEHGIRKKTKEVCDQMIKLSSNKHFKSFNVSVATGIILSEILRQRKC